MHNRFQTRLLFPLQPSKQILGALCAMHGLAVAGVLLALPWNSHVLPSLVLLGISAIGTRRELLAAALSYEALELTVGGDWYCLGSEGERQPAQLAGHPFVLGRLVILPIVAGKRRYTIALDAANTRSDELRRLRVRLRLEPAMPAGAS